MNRPLRKITPTLVPKTEPEISWDSYVRIEPGLYGAYSRSARTYLDPGLKRWTCLLLFDVLSDDLFDVVARRVPLWLNLGDRERPHAGRRSRYFQEWIAANGGAPERKDRLSTTIFLRRIVRVRICDTKSAPPYSKIDKILSWNTGANGESLSQLVTQSSKAPVNTFGESQLREMNGKVFGPSLGRGVTPTAHQGRMSADTSPKGTGVGPNEPTPENLSGGARDERLVGLSAVREAR